jgi:hypothetical protein
MKKRQPPYGIVDADALLILLVFLFVVVVVKVGNIRQGHVAGSIADSTSFAITKTCYLAGRYGSSESSYGWSTEIDAK